MKKQPLKDSTGKLKDAAEKIKNTLVPSNYTIPAYGYMGNAYIGQDINIGVSSHFSKPLEGILGKIPHTLDLIYQAGRGVSLNNARFTHLKYWTGTDAPEISVQFVFETQIDSYYDVYRPVINLMRLALPEETKLGFYKSPIPTVKLIAKEAVGFLKGAGEGIGKFLGGTGGSTDKVKLQQKIVSGKSKDAADVIDNLSNSIEKTGFETNLYVGNNFEFRNIIIKNISPTFSSELAYAPIHFLNGGKETSEGPPAWFNPYTAGELVTKGYAQTVCAMAAQINNGVQNVGNLLKSLPGPVRDWVASNLKDIPSFPIRADVNVTFELQFPLTRNRKENAANSINSVFRSKGYERLY